MSKDTKNNESEKEVRSIADINPNERKNSVIDTLPPPLPPDKPDNESNKKQMGSVALKPTL